VKLLRELLPKELKIDLEEASLGPKGTEQNPYTLKHVKTKDGQLLVKVDDMIKALENFKGEDLLVDGIGANVEILGIYHGWIGSGTEEKPNNDRLIVVMEIKK
jgi:hypothetical protein